MKWGNLLHTVKSLRATIELYNKEKRRTNPKEVNMYMEHNLCLVAWTEFLVLSFVRLASPSYANSATARPQWQTAAITSHAGGSAAIPKAGQTHCVPGAAGLNTWGGLCTEHFCELIGPTWFLSFDAAFIFSRFRGNFRELTLCLEPGRGRTQYAVLSV